LHEWPFREVCVVCWPVVVVTVESRHCLFVRASVVADAVVNGSRPVLHLVEEVVGLSVVVGSAADGLDFAEEELLEGGVEGGVGFLVGEGDHDVASLVSASASAETTAGQATPAELVPLVRWHGCTEPVAGVGVLLRFESGVAGHEEDGVLDGVVVDGSVAAHIGGSRP